ncbi:unnamed protein product [Effrenium voratum]|nr:unnamed protein product [Effrenium voratum]
MWAWPVLLPLACVAAPSSFSAAAALAALEDATRLEQQIAGDELLRITAGVGPLETFSFVHQPLGLLLDTATAALRHAFAAAESPASLLDEAVSLERQLSELHLAHSKEPLFFWHGPKWLIKSKLQHLLGTGPWHAKLKELASQPAPVAELVGKEPAPSARTVLEGLIPRLGVAVDDTSCTGAVCELDFGLKDSSLHVLVLPSSEAVLEAAAAAITKAKAAGQKVFVSLSLPPEILDSLDQKEASDARRVERHLGGYVDAVKEALKEVDLVWLPYAAFKKQFWAGTQKMLEKKKWAYGVHAEVGQASVARKLLDRSPRPTAWLTADDLLRPAHEAAVAAALDLGVACVSLPRKAPGSLAELYFRGAGFEAPSSAAAVQHAWHRGMAAVLRGKLVASEVTEASVPAMVNLLTAAAVAADHTDRFQGAKAPLEAALNSGRALLGKDATATTKEADAIFPGVTATTLSGLAEQAKVFKGNNHIIYAEDFFNKATFAAIKEETERLWRSKDIEANCNLDGTNRLGGYILDLVPANSSLYRLVYGNDPFRQWVSAVNAEGPMWPADFPIELREYGRESKGMGCHPDLQMYKVPRKDLEFAFTVDNDSRCNVTFWDLAGKQHFVQTKPNSLMMVGVNAATHCVSSTDGGTRSILKFIYVGDYRKSNEFWYYTSNECDDQNPNRQMLADRRAQRSAEVHASEL